MTIIYLKIIKYYKYKSLVYLLYLFIILYSIKTLYPYKLKRYIKVTPATSLKIMDQDETYGKYSRNFQLLIAVK